MELADLGWTSHFAQSFEEYTRQSSLDADAAVPGRVTFHTRDFFRVETEDGEVMARLAGRFRQATDVPVVGDWVVVEKVAAEGSEPRVVHTLARKTKLSRKVPGDRATEQVVAANVDTVFVVMGLDGDFNTRRVERFCVMAAQSGAEPVVVLTKTDLCEDPAAMKAEVADVTPGVTVVAVSAVENTGMEPLQMYFEPGHTVVMVGSSGAGKSTLLNRLHGSEVMRTGAVRDADDRGRHTTTHRELVRMPGGGLLIDNPGIRELQLWTEDAAAIEDAFEDIDALAADCRFRDCTHENEPGCAVRAAIAAGELTEARLENMRTLNKEHRYLELRRDDPVRRRMERKQGQFYKSVQASKKKKNR
ncbi:MAG: ribosome small subunit-dependent GTPase A [bacterium]|nr:ribosome small subunit-dependent GTPase A [bacterium]